MFRKLFAAAAVSSIIVMGGCASTADAKPSPRQVVREHVMKRCTAEDSSKVYPCLFDATNRGDNRGRSFVRYNDEHTEWVRDIMRWPSLYPDVRCEKSGKHFRCWTK